MVASDLILEALLNGLLLGGIYAVAALGLSLVFGIMDIVNLAHGHMLMVGAYVAIFLFTTFNITPIIGMIGAFVVLFALGMALQRVLLERVVGEGIEQPIIVLFGLALMLQSIGRIWVGSDAQATDIGIPGEAIDIAGASLSFPRMVTFAISILLILGTWAFLKFTTTGLAIRATAQNNSAAQYMGIDTDNIYVLTLGLGTGLAGAAGALLSMLFPITPFVGWSYLLKAFAVVVLGGVGSVAGTLVGGLILGVSENVGVLYLGGGFRDIISFSIFVLVLLVRPHGLFGSSGGGE
ncbi:branched-chain amino acid ABC transporter permease [Halobacterium bonnevillei]|uniref:Branched-chain amino acid ABC transporter permease n=1 Tax=Halobacterium bonnevillei TaxID=2692200 RepID=A0A6B0SHA7_9EURY|nr:branched-chain amino acid ABC transporter permease [Halobacterium bonnevillei]MXR19926.1 branched-chain amino acid ABC transporter permease [Halobacterium bonnevillei]